MIWNSLLVATGGMAGAMARYAMSRWIGKRFPVLFPLGTLSVNLSGSFFLGLLMGTNTGEVFSLLFGTGFLGAFTTFSTFKLESVQLAEQKEWRLFAVYLVLSYTLGIGLGIAGYQLGLFLQKP